MFSFFGSGGKQFLVFRTYGTFVQLQLCGCVSFLVVVGCIPQNENTFLQKNLIGLLYYDPLADVCILYDLTTLFYSVSLI